jgi:predicted hydrolase (HD superfamily)
VNREDIELGAAELGVPLEEHVGVVLSALQGSAGELGL